MVVERTRRDTARHLRRQPTAAEAALWNALRRLPLDGSHFRRQVPIGAFVADFACHAARLVVELDGGQHTQPADADYDARRTAWLERAGYRVLRFQNADVFLRIDEVLETIRAAMFGGLDVEGRKLVHQRTRHRRNPDRLAPP
jgi:very-short-patch-repair endonuclease